MLLLDPPHMRKAVRRSERKRWLRRVRRFVRRWVGISVALVSALVCLALALWSFRPAPKIPVPASQLASLSPTLTITMDRQGKAETGRGIVTVTTPDAVDGTVVRLDVQSALMTARLTDSFIARSATFTVPPDLLADSGLLVLRASTKSEVGSAAVAIAPAEPIDGVVPLAGPRSLVADNKHWTMVSIIPTDAEGNGLPDGTPIKLHVRRPDGSTTAIDGTIKGLLDGLKVFSGRVAGLTTLRVEVLGRTGPEVQIREVAGPPVPFGLELAPGPNVADGRSLMEVRTPLLIDQFGNVVEDGTDVEVRGEAPDGPFRIVTSTIDGRAIIRLRSSTVPGTVALTANVAGTTSSPLQFELRSDGSASAIELERDGVDVHVRIGPVISSLGGYAADGTPVLIEVNGTQIRELQLIAGRASTSLQIDTGATVTVKVLGRSADATAP